MRARIRPRFEPFRASPGIFEDPNATIRKTETCAEAVLEGGGGGVKQEGEEVTEAII